MNEVMKRKRGCVRGNKERDRETCSDTRWQGVTGTKRKCGPVLGKPSAARWTSVQVGSIDGRRGTR